MFPDSDARDPGVFHSTRWASASSIVRTASWSARLRRSKASRKYQRREASRIPVLTKCLPMSSQSHSLPADIEQKRCLARTVLIDSHRNQGDYRIVLEGQVCDGCRIASDSYRVLHTSHRPQSFIGLPKYSLIHLALHFVVFSR